MGRVFRCEDNDPGVVFGAFDGVRDWHVNTYAVTDDVTEQELVSAHEERHLRLQQGTPYGAALAILGAAVQSGDYQMSTWITDINSARTTHETYATFMSVAHVDGGLELLTGNLRYLEYWRTGQIIYRAFEHSGHPLMVLEFLFHQLMSPRSSTSEHKGRFLEPAISLVHGESPDRRLARLVDLSTHDNDFVQAIIEAVVADHSVDTNLDRLAGVLGNAGIRSLDADSQDRLARQMLDAFNAESQVHHGNLRVRSRATSLEDQLDYLARETVRLHATRLPLRLGSREFPPNVHPLALLKRDHPEIGAHLWTVLLSGEEFRRQFDTIIDDDDGIYFGFLSCDRRTAPGHAYFLPVNEQPTKVTAEMAEIGFRTLTMTSISTLSKIARQVTFSDREPVFVLVDEAIRPFLAGLRDSGTVRWTTVAITGDRLLHAVLLTIEAKPLHFLWIGTVFALKSVLELLRRGSDIFQFAGADYPCLDAEASAVLRHLVGTFASLGPR